MADIQAMFHQVKVTESDTDFLLFLWWPQGNVDDAPVEYRMTVHLFGAVSSPSIANFALRKTAQDNTSNFPPERSVIYLSKWISNSRAVLGAVPQEDRAKEVKDLDLSKDQLPMERALGLQWCVQSDSFKFNITITKLLLQKLCRQDLGWDMTIPNTLSEQWTKWTSSLSQLTDFEVPRCFKPSDFGESVHNQIHHFSDASELGYGTVSYLRMTNAEGNICVAFLIGKAKVAPLKRQTRSCSFVS
ncbi:uncharacterized protein LOC117595338 [Tachysurus ichikawai]